MKVTEEECKPLNFFGKLPPHLKIEIDKLIIPILAKKYTKISELNYLLTTLYLLTPEMAEHLTKFSDDYQYHNILFLFDTIQPILSTIIENGDYYELYPEYLV